MHGYGAPNPKNDTERAVAMSFPELVNVPYGDDVDQWYLEDDGSSLFTSDLTCGGDTTKHLEKEAAVVADEEVPSTPATVETTMLLLSQELQANGLVAPGDDDDEDNYTLEAEMKEFQLSKRATRWWELVVLLACLIVVAGCGSLMGIAVIKAKREVNPFSFPAEESLYDSSLDYEESLNRTKLVRNWLGVEDEPPRGSPQGRAMHWLGNQDARQILRDEMPTVEVFEIFKKGVLPFELCGDLRTFVDRLVQRYAVLVIYFSTGATYPSAGYATMTGSRLGVCTWPGITCSHEGVVQSFTLDPRVVGTLPTEIGLLTSLQSLVLSAEGLTGTLPSEVFKISSLYELTASGSSLNAKLSTEIGKLTRLHVLDLSHGRFIGHLPTQLGKLTDLRTLELHSNDFIGTIPNRLSSLKLVTHASFHDTYLFGQMPNGVCNLMEVGRLEELSADCRDEVATDDYAIDHVTQQISCPCCTFCF